MKFPGANSGSPTSMPGTRVSRLGYRPPPGYRLTDAALLPNGRLLILTRGQASMRRLRGKVKWEGDLERSRLGRVAK